MTVTSSSLNDASVGPKDPGFFGEAEEDLPGRVSAVLIGIVGLVGVVVFGCVIGIPHLERHLRSDIERHALQDAAGVEVVVDGRTAVLAGSVRSADERRAVIDRVARRWGVARVDAKSLAVEVAGPEPTKSASAASAARRTTPAAAPTPTPNASALDSADRSRPVGVPTSTTPATSTTTTTVVDDAAIRRLETEFASIRRAAPIVFARSSPTLLASAQVTLDRIAAALSRTPLRIRIEAHTDGSGDPIANLVLSTQRAEAVRDALIARGVSPAIVTAVGLGEAKPIASNASAAGRVRNRRVEFVVVASVT